MSEFADLRIASKRAYYDNNKPYGESETITLYIYNAGPNQAVAPVVKTGYTGSMNFNAVTTTFRQAQEWRQPSQHIRSLTWSNLSNLPSHYEGWDMVTTLPDVQPGILIELNLSFPMLHESSYNDDTLNASVSSTTNDPRPSNNSTTYIITPNHTGEGPGYWDTPGHLANLDFNGRTAVEPLSRADLRFASARAYYNNNLPYGQSETLTFFVFNDGPTIATQPLIKAGYTTSMDYANVSCSGNQVWVPDGTDPSPNLENDGWQPLEDIKCHIDNWDVICTLPNIPPSVLYRIEIAFPMNHHNTENDYTAHASVSSDAIMLDSNSSFATYIITPNHNNDDHAYWQTKGNIAQLNGPTIPSGGYTRLTGWLLDTPVVVSVKDQRRQIPLIDLERQISTYGAQVMSYDIGQKALTPKTATDVEYGPFSEAITVSFSTDGQTQLSYRAHPDTLLYLCPTEIDIGQEKVNIGYWLPVRVLWAGAQVKGMDAKGTVVDVYVTDIHQAKGIDYLSAEPHMVSQSHGYVVGTVDGGGILTHNPRKNRLGDANVPAILGGLVRIANHLVATTTTESPQRYNLRYRRPTDPPPPSVPAPPVLPADVPRRDEHGNWLIYLYEEDTPGAVENARNAVERGHPWELTYDPNGAPARRSRSTSQFQSQSELLQLTIEELRGRSRIGQLDRDEYPPAIAGEGGSGAYVTYIEAGDNRRAGTLMGRQFTNYRMNPQPDGHQPLSPEDTFRYAIIHRNMAGLEYLGDDLRDETQIERPPTD